MTAVFGGFVSEQRKKARGPGPRVSVRPVLRKPLPCAFRRQRDLSVISSLHCCGNCGEVLKQCEFPVPHLLNDSIQGVAERTEERMQSEGLAQGMAVIKETPLRPLSSGSLVIVLAFREQLEGAGKPWANSSPTLGLSLLLCEMNALD